MKHLSTSSPLFQPRNGPLLARARLRHSRVLQSFFGFGQSAEVFIKLNETDSRKKVEVKGEGDQKHKLSVYYDGESITGEVSAAVVRRL